MKNRWISVKVCLKNQANYIKMKITKRLFFFYSIIAKTDYI